MPRPRLPELALALGNLGCAGRPDALRRPVARRRAVAARRRGAGRRLAGARAGGAAADQLARLLRARRAEGRLRRHERADRSGRCRARVLEDAPMLRGRLVRLNDVPVEEVKAPPEAQWVLNGDRGLSYADDVPRRLARHRRRVVAEGLRRRPAGLVRGRPRQQAGPQDRRQGHRQRARPQRDGDDLQPARGEVGEPRHQLRHAVLAQYAGGRAAQPAGRPSRCRTTRRSATEGAAIARARPGLSVDHRHPRQGCAGRRSTPCSPR